MTFMLIYAIAGLGLMLLAGFTGQFSMGHAAFLGVGAYAQAVLTGMGWPFPLALAVAAGCRPRSAWWWVCRRLRVKGIYLGMATLAFRFIVEEVLRAGKAVTGGNAGLPSGPQMFGWSARSRRWRSTSCAWSSPCWPRWACSTCCVRPPGAFVAIRDSEISAQSMGIHLAATRRWFALSAALAPAWQGRAVRAPDPFISPDQFNIIQSIDLLLMVVIGGWARCTAFPGRHLPDHHAPGIAHG